MGVDTAPERRDLVEFNDIYDKDRHLTGRVHCRGTEWHPGQYGMVVCVWVYDGNGRVLLTKRAPGKTAAGTWENSGGAVRTGEDSLTAVARELWEETGIRADPEQFELLSQCTEGSIHYDHYCLCASVPLSSIVLQPGETVDAQWADFSQVHRLIDQGRMCKAIARQFCRMEEALKNRQSD